MLVFKAFENNFSVSHFRYVISSRNLTNYLHIWTCNFCVRNSYITNVECTNGHLRKQSYKQKFLKKIEFPQNNKNPLIHDQIYFWNKHFNIFFFWRSYISKVNCQRQSYRNVIPLKENKSFSLFPVEKIGVWGNCCSVIINGRNSRWDFKVHATII